VRLARAGHELTARCDDDRGVEPEAVGRAVGGIGALVEGGVDVDAEVAGRLAREAHRRAGLEVLGDGVRGALRQRVGRVPRQRQLGEEDDHGACVGRRADAVAQQLDERVRVVDPRVLDEPDPHRRLVGIVDAGEGLGDAGGLDELHSVQYARASEDRAGSRSAPDPVRDPAARTSLRRRTGR
jgi:hypothetical protein